MFIYFAVDFGGFIYFINGVLSNFVINKIFIYFAVYFGFIKCINGVSGLIKKSRCYPIP
jgi:hypothetical protein